MGVWFSCFTPHFGAEPLTQQRPNILWGRLHDEVNKLLRFFDLVDSGQRRCDMELFRHKAS